MSELKPVPEILKEYFLDFENVLERIQEFLKSKHYLDYVLDLKNNIDTKVTEIIILNEIIDEIIILPEQVTKCADLSKSLYNESVKRVKCPCCEGKTLSKRNITEDFYWCRVCDMPVWVD